MTTKRANERYERRLRVVLRYDGKEYEAVTKNISIGGMYLVTDAPVPFGGTAELRFRLPTLEEETICAAHVRWSQPAEGVGVQFGSLRAREVWALNQLFREREKEEAEKAKKSVK